MRRYACERKNVPAPILGPLILVLFFLAFPVLEARAAEDHGDFPELRARRPVSSSVDVSREGSGYRTFTFEVPDDAFAVRLRISKSPADLDLFIQQGSEIQSYDYVDFLSTSEDYNESLFISRLSDPPLKDGLYYVDVVYQRASVPFKNWKRLEAVPFTLELEIISAREHQKIRPNMTYRGELSPDAGMAQIYAVELPEGIPRCRIDVFDTTADLDLLVGYETPVLTRANADFVEESLLGRESIVIDGSRDEPELPGGTYYITVFDQVSKEHPEGFALRVSLGSSVPSDLLKIPPFPRTDDELLHALHSTVEIIGEAGKGSGCIVNEEGLILTNWHVVRGFSGEPSDPLYVAVNYLPQEPPREMFRAKVIDYNEESDFALLELVSGLYGQEIPPGFLFPYFRLGDPEELIIGQPVSFLGYPGIGGTGSRASISLTRGIVSGFERSGERFLIKTDAVIHNGNSGGAAVNAYYELLGLPTVIIGRESVSIGFVNPVSEIPASWLRRIDGELY